MFIQAGQTWDVNSRRVASMEEGDCVKVHWYRIHKKSKFSALYLTSLKLRDIFDLIAVCGYL